MNYLIGTNKITNHTEMYVPTSVTKLAKHFAITYMTI